MRPVGYYAHHQGAGHWQRACAVASRLARPCTLIGTIAASETESPPGPLLRLPDDRFDETFAGHDGEADRPFAFHYAPLGHAGIRRRMAAIAAWINATEPSIMIIDVSVEVALFARLLSVPTIVVRLAGNRTDPAHLEAFRSAEALIAPFPNALEALETPDWVREKTLYAGFLDTGRPQTKDPSDAADDGRIVVVLGGGGKKRAAADFISAAEAVPGRAWHILGHIDETAGTRLPPNLHLHGWVEDAGEHISRAGIVVGGAGDGVVGLVASRRKRFICLPETRPYDEQRVKATALAERRAAVVSFTWPTTNWRTLIDDATSLDPSVIGSMVRPDGIGWLAEQIEAIAVRLETS